MKLYAVIVAGGKGLRMGGDLPKQFLPIGGMPVLMRTLTAFHACDPDIELILVLPASQQSFWKDLCEKYGFDVPYRLTDGGETRFHSVANGLAMIDDDGQKALVAVHDGVRPFVSKEVIEDCFREAQRCGAVVPVTEVVETLRQVEGLTSETVNRADFRLVQTPQTFDLALLKRAYRQEYSPFFTDDASVVEALGHPVALVKGNRENIKITTPFDLKIAEALLSDRS